MRDAVARLSKPGCATLLSDYSDEGGRTLRERLEGLGPGGARVPVYF